MKRSKKMLSRFSSFLHNAVEALAPEMTHLEQFRYHWKSVTQFFLDTSDERMSVESTTIPHHLEQMIIVLLQEEQEFGTSSHGPSMEFMLQHKILETMQTLGRADCPPGMKRQVLVFFTNILGKSKQQLLTHVNAHKPVNKLIRCCGEVKAAPTESEEVQFLLQVSSKLKQNSHLVNFFLEKPSSSENGSSPPLSTIGMERDREKPEYSLVDSLISLTKSEDSRVAIKACEGLILVTSIPEDNAASVIVLYTAFCERMADQLSKLFKSLPAVIDPSEMNQLSATWGFDHEDQGVPSFPGKRQMIAFFSWLDYVNQLSVEAHPMVSQALAFAIRERYILTAIEPGLTQASEPCAITVTALLTRCLKLVTSPMLAQEFAAILLGTDMKQEVPDNRSPHHIRRLLIQRINHLSDQLALETIRLFQALLQLPYQPIMDTLITRNFQKRNFINWSKAKQIDEMLRLKSLSETSTPANFTPVASKKKRENTMKGTNDEKKRKNSIEMPLEDECSAHSNPIPMCTTTEMTEDTAVDSSLATNIIKQLENEFNFSDDVLNKSECKDSIESSDISKDMANNGEEELVIATTHQKNIPEVIEKCNTSDICESPNKVIDCNYDIESNGSETLTVTTDSKGDSSKKILDSNIDINNDEQSLEGTYSVSEGSPEQIEICNGGDTAEVSNHIIDNTSGGSPGYTEKVSVSRTPALNESLELIEVCNVRDKNEDSENMIDKDINIANIEKDNSDNIIDNILSSDFRNMTLDIVVETDSPVGTVTSTALDAPVQPSIKEQQEQYMIDVSRKSKKEVMLKDNIGNLEQSYDDLEERGGNQPCRKKRVEKVVNGFLFLFPDALRTSDLVVNAGYDSYLRDAHKQCEQRAIQTFHYNWPCSSSGNDSEEDDDSEKFYEGAFLNSILRRLETILEQPFDINLEVTATISLLCQFQHPYLHEFLMDTAGITKESILTPHRILLKVFQEVRIRSSRIPNCQQLLISMRKNMNVPNELHNIHAESFFQAVIILEEFCKELAAIAFVTATLNQPEEF